MKAKKAIAGFLLAALAVGAVFAMRAYTIRQARDSSLAVSSDLKIKGSLAPKVTIVVYSDFQCPACQAAAGVEKEILAEYGKDIQIVFHHFPLQGHVWSPLAHQAAECAKSQGKFWEFHDRLYDTQTEWSTPANPADRFNRLAERLGMNMDHFAACLSDPKIAEKVHADKRRGDQLLVRFAPTYFVNGERVVGPVELKVKGVGIIRQALGLPVLPSPPPPPAENM